jgi:hypothetical protein
MPDHPAIKALLEWKPDALIDAKLDFGSRRLRHRAGGWLQLL